MRFKTFALKLKVVFIADTVQIRNGWNGIRVFSLDRERWNYLFSDKAGRGALLKFLYKRYCL